MLSRINTVEFTLVNNTEHDTRYGTIKHVGQNISLKKKAREKIYCSILAECIFYILVYNLSLESLQVTLYAN